MGNLCSKKRIKKDGGKTLDMENSSYIKMFLDRLTQKQIDIIKIVLMFGLILTMIILSIVIHSYTGLKCVGVPCEVII